jgi:Ser/Thr protein kinase RdoA (MazF antagonist)
MTPPRDVLAAYGFAQAQVTRIAGGLINRTYLVTDQGQRAVLQALHPVFAAEVNFDIEAVTTHLANKGLVTPRLVRTSSGAAWVESAGEVWRTLTFVDGTTLHAVTDPAQARAGFALIAEFHRAVADLDYEFQFTRAGVHDTAGHLARLARVGAGPLGQQILAAATDLPGLADLPKRVSHGDLKISNLLFAPGSPPRGLCLIDLDTLGRQNIAYELGDALRSWCNPSGEDVVEPAVNLAVFAAAIHGYAQAGGGCTLTDAECRAIVPGLETVCIELAARFCVDMVEDRYFGWDSQRFPSRSEHNRVRAQGQLALAASVRRHRAQLDEIVARELG